VRDGVLVVDKPEGMTSHDVVAVTRRALSTRAVGHAGTLDPMATGVLLLLIGEATKLNPYLSLETKEYVADVTFGRATDTLDREGATLVEIAPESVVVDPVALEAALAAELGRTSQVPPSVSAIKVDGERSHRLARRGMAKELPPRVVSVGALELLAVEPPRITLRVRASKGYYVRALARDVGERLGLPAHLSALRRTASGSFALTDATPWPPTAGAALLPLAAVVRRCLPVATLTDEGRQRARTGKRLGPEHFREASNAVEAAWLDGDEHLVAVGRADGDGFRVVRGFS
jgi:tRNA pseudouridine55 synthase